MSKLPWERFPALEALASEGLVHGFSRRRPGLEMSTDRVESLRALAADFEAWKRELDLDPARVFSAEQIHSDGLAKVSHRRDSPRHIEAVDGLWTEDDGTALEILVADCCAVYLVDPRGRRAALVHSGRKGTELDIAGQALDCLLAAGTEAQDVVVQLSPCIGPPHYEVDFAKSIRASLASRGVSESRLHGPSANTGADLDAYYSYRMEKGRTGRMMALLGWRDGG